MTKEFEDFMKKYEKREVQFENYNQYFNTLDITPKEMNILLDIIYSKLDMFNDEVNDKQHLKNPKDYQRKKTK